MEFHFTFLSLALYTVLLILLALLLLVLKIFVGKSITSSNYAPVFGTIYGLVFHSTNFYDHLTDLTKKRRTFRLIAAAHSQIFTTDVRNVEHMLKTRFENYTIGSHNQDIFYDMGGDGIFFAEGEKWKQQRKLASYEFSTKVLRDFSCTIFRKHAAKFVRMISDLSHSGRVFDMQELVKRYTLDSIFKVGFGVDLRCIDNTKEGNAFMKAIDESTDLMGWRYIDPFWKIKRFFNIGSEASVKKNMQILDTMVYEMIRNKRKLLHQENANEKKEDILTRFLLVSEKDPIKMNDKYLRDITLSFVGAGKDTTAATMSWFLYSLCKNPLVQEKVAEEVRQITGLEVDQPEVDIHVFMQTLTDSALDKMHYLHAALTETLRLYPPAPQNGRTVEMDDVLPDGHRVKKGDVLWYVAYSMGRTTEIWGEDAEDFRPERWLENGIYRPESPFKFIAFHAGPRVCLGRDFAYRQMKILSAGLLHFLRFKLADEAKDVKYSLSLTLFIDEGLPLVALPRRKIL